MSQTVPSAAFHGLVDLASASLGGQALGATDDFFAAAERMLDPSPAVFIADRYTDRGKWMDGWESRRKRGPGYDHCLVKLGVPGSVLAFDIDTSFFNGNQPAFASVDGVLAPPGLGLAELAKLPFHEVLGQVPLLPSSHNLFVAQTSSVVSHLRLNIFPDGGVARFRAFGKVAASWPEPLLDEATRALVKPGWFDLAALANGALALACSDAHFGGMNNLLLPGRSVNMGSGWETRRRRGPGHDWIVIQLGARGVPRVVEVDTNHFKGNFPERCALDGIDAEGARPSELVASSAWHAILPEQRLQADFRHFYAGELSFHQPVTHVRLRIFPDGGVSRLRLWGERSLQLKPTSEAVERLNAASDAEARELFTRCCGASGWVDGMLRARPFASGAELLRQAELVWRALGPRDYLEAFAHHPEIGADLSELRRKFASTAALAESEQAGAVGADDATLLALREKNQAYRARFGHVFIVCATGKSAAEMLHLLEQRLHNAPELEVSIAAAEQAKITRLRLEKL